MVERDIGQVKRAHPVRVCAGDRLGEAAADVAAGDDVPVVSQFGEHRGDRLRHRLPGHAGGVRVGIPGKARHDDVDVGEQRQHPGVPEERVGPPVQQHDGRGAGIRGPLLDRAQPVRCPHPRQRQQPGLGGPPVMPVGPVGDQVGEMRSVRAAFPSAFEHRDEPGAAQPCAKVVQLSLIGGVRRVPHEFTSSLHRSTRSVSSAARVDLSQESSTSASSWLART